MKSESENDLENRKRIDEIEESIQAALLFDNNLESNKNYACIDSQSTKIITYVIIFLILSLVIVLMCLLFIH
jgi:hypothetical protein